MTARETLLRCLDQAYDHRSWHGTNLRGALRGVSMAQAIWRPGPNRHNIWEIVVHAAYWKYAVRRRLTGEKRGSFPLKGSNWFRRSTPDEAAWKADVALLAEEHRRLRDTIATARRNEGFFMISGITAHDLYHAGQIQLLKALKRGRSARLNLVGNAKESGVFHRFLRPGLSPASARRSGRPSRRAVPESSRRRRRRP